VKANEFVESTVFKELDVKVQELLRDLLIKLKELDYVVIKRNEPVLVLKVRKMYESNPRSRANIATIRLKNGYITIGPYKNRDENIVICSSRADITDSLIQRIRSIYTEKVIG
jgi:hypothetical protein